MADQVINIASDFTRYPGPRHIEDGPKSGEEFRDTMLIPRITNAVQSGGKVVIVLDGARGYTSSFLEEAFGGLVRLKSFTRDQLDRILEIRVSDPKIRYLAGNIRDYISSTSAAA
ncbi:MAG: STAS-like domain-containing protein [Hyphomicrobiaceae bacterium]|nr:STAS-like domain-containing protein [Hyphomicrobiaceae bacterium]